MSSRQKQVWKIVLTVMVLVWISAMAVWGDAPDQFVNGTTVNGIGISGLTVEEAKAEIQKSYTDTYQLTLLEKDGRQEIINGAQVHASPKSPEGLQAILDEQNATGRQFGPSVDNSHTMEIPVVYDEKLLEEKINSLACVSSGDIIKTADAHVSGYEAGKPFTIIPEVVGNDVDVPKLTALIKAAVSSGAEKVDLVSEGCYRTPGIRGDDETLKQQCQLMNQCKDMVITYTFGDDQKETLAGDVIVTWITGTENGEISVDRDQVAAYVAELAKKYDTAGTARVFHTTGGKDVTLTGPYGFSIDQAGEIDALTAAIRTGQTQTREPLYAQKGASRTAPDWGNTYVEVDLTAQYGYMYQDGTLMWKAPCVTGSRAKNYTTPEGIYSLTYKQKDRVLRGEKKPDGTYEYESHVDYWMPFNGGIGLHDANWRSNFGGEIYKKSGSHGCVNLPPSKAKELYDLVYKGIPVICYN